MVQFWPDPTGAILRLQVMTGHLALNGRHLKTEWIGRCLVLVGEGRGTSPADHTDRIHGVGAEPERPQEPRRRDASVDLAVVAPVLHFDDIVGRDGARELR